MRKFITGALGLITFILIFGAMFYMLYDVYQDRNSCNRQIEFNDGTIIMASRVDSWDSGMTSYKSCDDESNIQVPTSTIKSIKEIKVTIEYDY